MDSAPLPLVVTPQFDEAAIALSPDGQWLAYESNETGRTEVFIRPFPDTDRGKIQVSNNGGVAPLWAPSGREFFYVNANREMVVVPVGPGRDIPQLGPRIPAETLRRFWTMLAHEQGQLINHARIAAGLGVSGQTVTRYLDLMADLLLVRALRPWSRNVRKRLVRSPKVYVRDSGIAHALLGLRSRDDVLAHPVAGPSWEGYAIENLCAAAPRGTAAWFYRSAAGAEIDLVLEVPGAGTLAIEIKRSLAPALSRGFVTACEDVRATRRYLVYPGAEAYPLDRGTSALPLAALVAKLASRR